jgi:hypothetical protein
MLLGGALLEFSSRPVGFGGRQAALPLFHCLLNNAYLGDEDNSRPHGRYNV